MIAVHARRNKLGRRGITLTEILIATLILSVGLASLATLFPLGLLRFRDAARSTRSAYLMESAASDLVSRGLLTSSSFTAADNYNYFYSPTLTAWFTTSAPIGGQTYTPLTQDTPGYYQDWYTPASKTSPQITLGADAGASDGYYGLPFAYDPLWRFQTMSKSTGLPGYYMGDTLEARFGPASGLSSLTRPPMVTRPAPTVCSGSPTLIGRITWTRKQARIRRSCPYRVTVPAIFVSPEDVVWVENVASSSYSPVLADISIATNALGNQTSINDWHYSWMFTGQQNNTGTSSTFEGNIVIFENRPFAIEVAALIPNPPGGIYQAYQVEGETVVEAIWGYSTNISSYAGGAPGYGTSADRAVLLRWYASEPDPVVHVGDWIADVTYERSASGHAVSVLRLHAI